MPITARYNPTSEARDFDFTLSPVEILTGVLVFTTNTSPSRVITLPRRIDVLATNLVFNGDVLDLVVRNDSANDLTLAANASGEPVYGNPLIPAGEFRFARYAVNNGFYIR